MFTGELEEKDVLINDGIIAGVGAYDVADEVIDITGKVICPGFIDSHIHIESTMLTPPELAKAILPHGTTAVVADPHEIANVCGTDGIEYMLAMSNGLPLNVYFMLPSCVPSTPFDESGAVLNAKELLPFYNNKNILGLAEVMNYPGVLAGDNSVIAKINDCLSHNKVADGHAPLLSGNNLDKYIAAGITSDHECSDINEALEKLRKGQWIMIRQGTAAKNLKDLTGLFDPKYSHRCLLVSDDRHPADLINEGHIDYIIREAVKLGQSAITAIQMATIQPATYFGLKQTGAIAPGYKADLLILNDLNTIDINAVYCNGAKVDVTKIITPEIPDNLKTAVGSTINMHSITAESFKIDNKGKCRVIEIIPGQLLTKEVIEDISTAQNILKIAVIERHNKTGHIGLGYVKGIGLKQGAIASTVAHDSHNMTVIGTNDEDMAFAAQCLKECGGGLIAVCDGKIIAQLPLNIAGIMSCESAEAVAEKNEALIKGIRRLGVPENISPLMLMAFLSLSVIPDLKLTTHGLIDVNSQKLVSLNV